MADPGKNHAGLIEAPDRWIFPVADHEVTQIVIDYALGITVHSGVHFRIGSPFEYSTGEVVKTIDPQATTALGQFATLHKAVIKTGYALKDGHLVLDFSDGRAIRVAPSEQFEAWNATTDIAPAESRFEVVALPSGGLAIFRER